MGEGVSERSESEDPFLASDHIGSQEQQRGRGEDGVQRRRNIEAAAMNPVHRETALFGGGDGEQCKRGPLAPPKNATRRPNSRIGLQAAPPPGAGPTDARPPPPAHRGSAPTTTGNQQLRRGGGSSSSSSDGGSGTMVRPGSGHRSAPPAGMSRGRQQPGPELLDSSAPSGGDDDASGDDVSRVPRFAPRRRILNHRQMLFESPEEEHPPPPPPMSPPRTGPAAAPGAAPAPLAPPSHAAESLSPARSAGGQPGATAVVERQAEAAAPEAAAVAEAARSTRMSREHARLMAFPDDKCAPVPRLRLIAVGPRLSWRRMFRDEAPAAMAWRRSVDTRIWELDERLGTMHPDSV